MPNRPHLFILHQGFLNAAKLSSFASGKPLSSHRILFLGAGSAGVGVAMQLLSFFTLQGLSVDEARERIWLFDSQGLIYDARGPMAEHKKCMFDLKFSLSIVLCNSHFLADFSRRDYSGPPLNKLLDVIAYVKPTALLGLSTITVMNHP
jgi:malate dehydrogenase (oxaloacetate-decarboxylating)(NADP+)